MSNWKKWGGPLDESGAMWFVNRDEELEWLWEWASNVPNSYPSLALIGLRRTGKTAILHKLYNRLYHEQTKVMPVYISFAEYVRERKMITAFEFVKEYYEGYLRSYLAFKYRKPHLQARKAQHDQLVEFTLSVSDKMALEMIDLIGLYKERKDPLEKGRMSQVIALPRAFVREYETPTMIIIDEFQALTEVVDVNYNNRVYDVTNFFQHASETMDAPLIVSGSSVSMMIEQALGGSVSGRFDPIYIDALEEGDAVDMIIRLGDVYNIQTPPDLIQEVWEASKGYPYSIECMMRSRMIRQRNPSDSEWLEKFIIHMLTNRHSPLRVHYHEEYGKYITRMNPVTRQVLLWIIKHPKRRIFADEIAAELALKEADVQQSLDQLYEVDVIESTGWLSFEGPRDPMLRKYIRYQHNHEVEKLAPEQALDDIRTEINRIRGEASRKVGHLAEVIVAAVMSKFDQRVVDGKSYFGLIGDVELPNFQQLERREGIIKQGDYNEVDVIGEYRIPTDDPKVSKRGAWLVSVRYREQKMGEGEVKKFMGHAAVIQKEKQYDEVIHWYFSKRGFTQAGIRLLEGEGIFHSDVEQFNKLANLFGFLGLHF
ncbi:MAG: ATP-binding protein [Chloroflexota bacterium]